MIKIAHILNPVKVGESSDLFIAQPITFETMRRAKDYAGSEMDIELFSSQYPEDHGIIPDYFMKTRDLDRSVLDLGQFQVPRKLPILRDILDRLYEVSEADYFIYTNSDIGLMPYFYVTVKKLIEAGNDSFVINRRTISDKYKEIDDIPLMCSEVGEPHKGYDCFVFKREDYPKYVLGDVCLGIAWVGRALLANLFIHSKKFYEFKKLHLTFHIGNSLTWRNNDFEDYTTHNKSIFDLIISQAENERKSFSKNEMSYLTDIGPKRYQPFDQDIDSLTDSGDKK